MSQFSHVQRTREPFPSPSAIQAANTPISAIAIISELEQRFPAEFELLRRVGVHYDSGPQQFFDPFSRELRTEDFSNVGTHCALVAYAAQRLATHAVQVAVLSQHEALEIVRAALLHDVFKPWDAFYARARRSGLLQQSNPGIDKICSEQTITGLRNRGFKLEEATRLEREIDTGLDPREICQRILVVDDNGALVVAPGHFRDKIIWLADCMTCSVGSGPNPINYYLVPLERFILSGSFEKYSHSAQNMWRFTSDRRWIEQSSPDFAGVPPLFEGNIYDISLILTGLSAMELFKDSHGCANTAEALRAAKHLLLQSLSDQPLTH